MGTELLPSRQIFQRACTQRIRLVVRGMPNQCWRCGYNDLAVVAVHLEGFTEWWAVVATEENLALAYAAELLEAGGHPQRNTIKVRRSRTADASYLSNGCSQCDALFGRFFLAEDFAGVQANEEVHTLPVLATVERAAIEWYLLDGLRSTSGNLE